MLSGRVDFQYGVNTISRLFWCIDYLVGDVIVFGDQDILDPGLGRDELV